MALLSLRWVSVLFTSQWFSSSRWDSIHQRSKWVYIMTWESLTLTPFREWSAWHLLSYHPCVQTGKTSLMESQSMHHFFPRVIHLRLYREPQPQKPNIRPQPQNHHKLAKIRKNYKAYPKEKNIALSIPRWKRMSRSLRFIYSIIICWSSSN